MEKTTKTVSKVKVSGMENFVEKRDAKEVVIITLVVMFGIAFIVATALYFLIISPQENSNLSEVQSEVAKCVDETYVLDSTSSNYNINEEFTGESANVYQVIPISTCEKIKDLMLSIK
jgi:hypothetical protein